jgi:hypothetical protein
MKESRQLETILSEGQAALRKLTEENKKIDRSLVERLLSALEKADAERFFT